MVSHPFHLPQFTNQNKKKKAVGFLTKLLKHEEFIIVQIHFAHAHACAWHLEHKLLRDGNDAPMEFL